MIHIPRNKVAIIPMDDPDVTPGGIIIPEMARERTDQGIIKYVGDNVKILGIGMHVLFSGYSGSLIHLEGEGRLIIIHQDFVLAELPDPPTTDVPGLYFKGRDGTFFIATYELGMELMAKALHEAPWFRRIGVTKHKPAKDEQAVSFAARGSWSDEEID
jgi:chaperonin GroES